MQVLPEVNDAIILYTIYKTTTTTTTTTLFLLYYCTNEYRSGFVVVIIVKIQNFASSVFLYIMHSQTPRQTHPTQNLSESESHSEFLDSSNFEREWNDLLFGG